MNKLISVMRLLILICAMGIAGVVNAQIGYQVTLLNNATGEPRANESVNIQVKITDSEGNIVCEENKNEVTNDFGVVSMSVGNSETFANANWNNLPFFIEATVDNHLIGRSQLLSVPVAEYAKNTGTLTKELLCSKKWIYYEGDRGGYDEKDFWEFTEDGKFTRTNWGDVTSGVYEIDGNIVNTVSTSGNGKFFHYNKLENCLIDDGGTLWK